MAQAGELISPDTIFAAAHNRQPVVVWVAFGYQPQAMHYMRTFAGRTVMYGAPWEHAVTISGWAPGYVLINNPHSHAEWIDAGTFAAAYSMFNQMAVILQKTSNRRDRGRVAPCDIQGRHPRGGTGQSLPSRDQGAAQGDLPIVDRPVIEWAVAEARSAGAQEVALITSPGKEFFDAAFRAVP